MTGSDDGDTRKRSLKQRLLAMCPWVLLVLVIYAGFWFAMHDVEQLVVQRLPPECRRIVSSELTRYHLEHLARAQDREEEFLVIGKIGDELKAGDELRAGQYEWTVLKPGRNTARDRNASDAAIVAGFVSDPSMHDAGLMVSADQSLCTYYQPVRARQSCLTCHTWDNVPAMQMQPLRLVANKRSDTPLLEGQLMAVVKVSLPYGPMEHDLNLVRAVALAAATVTSFLALALVRWVSFGRSYRP